ncbi:hypothetical protein LCGC14_2847530, partial [marine sediment metagenome]
MGDGQDEALKIEAAGIEVQAAAEKLRPSSLYKPALSIDGDQWCALYGANLQDGVVGFGISPDAAYRAFDEEWYKKLPPKMECECGHRQASHLEGSRHCCACRCTQFVQANVPESPKEPELPTEPDPYDSGELCECGHE